MTVSVTFSGAADEVLRDMRIFLGGSGATHANNLDVTIFRPGFPDTSDQDEATTPSGEFRPYGQPSGTVRRTKVELAEDKDIETLAGELGIQKIPTDVPATGLLADLRARFAEKTAAKQEILPPEPEVTIEDVKDAVAKVLEIKSGDMDATQDWLEQNFQTRKISGLKPEQFADVLKAAQAMDA